MNEITFTLDLSRWCRHSERNGKQSCAMVQFADQCLSEEYYWHNNKEDVLRNDKIDKEFDNLYRDVSSINDAHIKRDSKIKRLFRAFAKRGIRMRYINSRYGMPK